MQAAHGRYAMCACAHVGHMIYVLCQRTAVLVCPCGTFKRLTLLKAALFGKDATLVGEFASWPLPGRRLILMHSSWGLFYIFCLERRDLDDVNIGFENDLSKR